MTPVWLTSQHGLETHPQVKWLVRLRPTEKWSFLATDPPSKNERKCCVRNCRHLRSHNKRTCHRCEKTRLRINNPLYNQFNNLRDSARKKKIPFTLTRQQFDTFALESGYHEGCGRTLGSLHVDRRDPLQGYSIDNIRALEAGENSRKGCGEDKRQHWLERRRGRGEVIFTQPDMLDENYVGF